MIESQVLNAVGDYGLQAVMLLFFMFRTEKAIKNNTEAVNKFNIIISKCNKR